MGDREAAQAVVFEGVDARLEQDQLRLCSPHHV